MNFDGMEMASFTSCLHRWVKTALFDERRRQAVERLREHHPRLYRMREALMRLPGPKFEPPVKKAMLEPGELVTRQDLAQALKPKKWRDKDFDDNQPGMGGATTADRTAIHPAFD